MRYISTRGAAPALAFDDVLLAGLARDGGLYVPEEWPLLSASDLRGLVGLEYADIAARVMRPFLGGRIDEDAFARIVREAYGAFGHTAVAPLKQLDGRTWLMELFHGPTLAFKDMALQLLGPLYEHVLAKRGTRVTIVGATSGDTGSAAIEAFRDRAAVDIFILHPLGRVSEVQRRQMTTVLSPNVFNIAVEGSFDDCQDLLKAMFNDHRFRDELNLSAVNSINWARVMAQIGYYFAAATALGGPHRPVSFIVPTGNFGDILAGYAARRMGLPIEQLTIATNDNDILVRAHATGLYEVRGVKATTSPSMDIQVSSNFERYLFEACGRDAAWVRARMGALAQSGRFELGQALEPMRRDFLAASASEAEVADCIRRVKQRSGYLLDPHTACGVVAAEKAGSGAAPRIVLATAHPAKFPDALQAITAERPALPPRFASLMHDPERITSLPNDLAAVERFVASLAAQKHGAAA